MRDEPEGRLPRPIDPVGRSSLGRRSRWALHRYERRWGFLPSEGRTALPPSGRPVLYRVDWGRHGLEVCVMLARWEHAGGAWARVAVVDHEWVDDAAGDGVAIGAARHRLGALGERLEEEADTLRLAGTAPALALSPVPGAPVDPPIHGAPSWRGWATGLGLVAVAGAPAVRLYVMALQEASDARMREAWGWALGGPLAVLAVTLAVGVVVQRRRLRAAGLFAVREGLTRLPPDGRTVLYRVERGWRGRAACVMVRRWEYLRGRWRPETIVEHVWADRAALPEATRLLEASARVREAAEAGDAAGPSAFAPPLHRPPRTFYDMFGPPRTRYRGASEAELDLRRRLDAAGDLVEDLAEDPR